MNGRIETIQKRIEQIRKIETQMYEDKLLGKIDENIFNNIAHTLNNEADNLNEEHSQFIIILDMIEDSRKGIDTFVHKIERFANYTITPNDRLVFFSDVGMIE